MPQPIEFDKAYAEYLLDCLANGKPIKPLRTEEQREVGWRRFDQLLLAGAAHFAYISHGPIFEQPDLTQEQKVENEGTFGEEVLTAIVFLSQLFEAVKYNEYDEQWEPVMKAIVSGRLPKARVLPLEGWKGER